MDLNHHIPHQGMHFTKKKKIHILVKLISYKYLHTYIYIYTYSFVIEINFLK